MRTLLSAPFVALLLTASTAAQELSAAPGWPSFRGAFARGVSEGHPVATHWNVAQGTNVLWSTAIPGLAHSSPVVWGDRLFVTTAVRVAGDAELLVGLYGSPVPEGNEGVHKFQVWCLDRTTGQVLWVRTSIETEPKYLRHTKGSHAASTPAVDGERVVACFASEGLFAYTLDGELLWEKQLGDLDSGWYMAPGAQFGFASSPVIHEGVVFLQVDVQENSSLWAMDAETGADVWRTPREDVPTWGSPTVDVEDGRSQIIVNGYHHMGGYDLATGAELWKLSGGGDVPVPTPVVGAGTIYITNGHGRWNPIYAIVADARGEIADGFEPEKEEHLRWSQPRRGTYMQTPIVYGGRLFACTDAGVLTCIDLETGENLNRRRLGTGQDGFTASPVAGDGKLYLTSEEGVIVVVAADEEMEVLAENDMGEICMATPALVEGVLYVRTQGHVVAVAGDAPPPPEVSVEAVARIEEPAAVQPALDAASSAAADLPSGSDLFAAHVEARGGLAALERPTHVRTRGKFEVAGIGLEGEMVVHHASGRSLTSVQLGPMGEMLTGYDGETGWILSEATGALVLEGAMLEEVEREADWLGDTRYAERFASLTTRTRADFHGFDCYEVLAKATGGAERKFYFDADTGLLRGIDATTETLVGETRAITVIQAYGEFDGIQVPTVSKILVPGQNMSQVVTVTDVSFEPFADEVFDLPAEVRKKLGD